MGWVRIVFGVLAAGVLPAAAAAECLGQCANGLEAVLTWAAIGLALVVVTIILLFLRRWRLALILWGIAVAVAFVPVMITEAWLGWKVRGMEAREALATGAPPALAERKVLLINLSQNCAYGACNTVLAGAGRTGVLAVGPDALKELDLSQPIDLATLPIARWVISSANADGYVVRAIDATGRAALAAEIDYVVLVSDPYSRREQGPVEDVLRKMPGLSGMRKGEVLRLAMAPLGQKGVLSMGGLTPDILDLWMVDRALAPPFAPGNTNSALNGFEDYEVAAESMCPRRADLRVDLCAEMLRYGN